MLAALGVADRSRVLMVGDNLLTDIQGGANAGLDTAWYRPGHAPRTAGIVPTYERFLSGPGGPDSEPDP